MNAPTIAICTPMRDKTTAEYDFALTHNSPPAIVCHIAGAPVDDARNALVRSVLALSPRPEFVVWADSDAYWLPGTIERLISDLEANLSLIAPWHGKRSPDSGPTAFRKTGTPNIREQLPRPEAPLGGPPAVVMCDEVGSHFMVHRTELLDALELDPFTITDDGPGPEDFEFCRRVRELGGTIAVDCTLPVAHIGVAIIDGVRTTVGFVPHAPPCRIIDGAPIPVTGDVQYLADPRGYGEQVNRALIAAGVPLAA